MDNRRQTYRHLFVKAEKAGVEMTALEERNPLRGELIDLSIDGLRVRIDGPTTIEVGTRLTIQEIRRHTPPAHLLLGFVSQVKYIVQEGPHVCLGIEFLRQGLQELNNLQESKLRRFLVEEQRRMLRYRLAVQDE